MPTPNLTRRGLLLGAGATLLAAPAIVRAASLMPVKNRLLPWDAGRWQETPWGARLADGSYVYSDELSYTLQRALQPMCKFRQLCEANHA